MELTFWGAKAFGAAVGVLISMVMVAPKSTANGLYRLLLAPVAGVIFAPAVQNMLWFLNGEKLENVMAAACAAGFVCWFILEFVARMLSSDEWLSRLLEETLRLRGKAPAATPTNAPLSADKADKADNSK